jgi:hypothetical protein
MFRAINCSKGWYPNPTGAEIAEWIPRAEQTAKGWFQNLQGRPHWDVFRSIPGRETFEKTLGTLSPDWHPPRLSERGSSRGKGLSIKARSFAGIGPGPKDVITIQSERG